MKYAVLVDDKKFEIREGEIPKVKGAPIIKVSYVGICGTDMSYWMEGSKHKELIIGHEYSGIIEDPGTSGLFKKGDRVAGYTQNVYNENCGHCEFCLRGENEKCNNRKVYTWKGGDYTHPGAYSEYTTWFPKSIFKLPEGISLEEGALIEPFTVGLHAVVITKIKPGDKVLILGGGIIGLAVSEWAKIYGASLIAMTEMNKEKIKKIKEFGIVDSVVEADAVDIDNQLQNISDGGFDVVFDCAGFASAINTGINALKKEMYKKFTALALPHGDVLINYRDIVLRQINFKGSKGHIYEEFKTVARAVSNGNMNLKKYISREISFNKIQDGFEQIHAEAGKEIKAIIKMD